MKHSVPLACDIAAVGLLVLGLIVHGILFGS